MSRFNSKPSAEYEAAVGALKALPLQQREQAFADAYAADFKAVASKRLGVRAKGRKSWVRLIGRKPDPYDQERLPADDHTELWVDGDQLTYVSHPYQVSFGEMKEIVALCEQHSIECSIDAASWHYPSSTLRLLWKPARQSKEP